VGQRKSCLFEGTKKVASIDLERESMIRRLKSFNQSLVLCGFIIQIVLCLNASANEGNFQEGASKTVFLQILRADSSEEADWIASQIKEGVPFDDLARDHSPEALKEKSGYLGEIVEDRLDPAIRSVISDLKVGEISGKIRTREGYLFIRLLGPEQAASHEAPAGSVEYFVELGLILGELSDEGGEIRAYERAIHLNPNKVEAYINLGEVYRRKALRVFERQPWRGDQAPAESHPAIPLLDEAIVYFKLALEVAPESPEAHYDLGLAYAAGGEFGLAELEIMEALRLRPGDGEIQKSMAAVLFIKGDYEKAWLYAQKAKDTGADVTLLANKIQRELIKKTVKDK
jgi:tetratricopeptide (TPR) repeat protein